MHHSRLHVILIDTPPDSAEATTSFWCAALGTAPEPEPDSPFTVLATLLGGEVVAHQRLESGTPRLHLDIETDNVAAEVDRLVGLGAHRVSATGGCVQLLDPAGLIFCVVPVQSDDFQQHATTWDRPISCKHAVHPPRGDAGSYCSSEPGSAGTSTAQLRSAVRGTIVSTASDVAASTTGAATPSLKARAQFAAVTHQRSPGTSPGKRY